MRSHIVALSFFTIDYESRCIVNTCPVGYVPINDICIKAIDHTDVSKSTNLVRYHPGYVVDYNVKVTQAQAVTKCTSIRGHLPAPINEEEFDPYLIRTKGDVRPWLNIKEDTSMISV